MENFKEKISSPVLKSSLIFVIAYISNHFLGFEIENQFIESLLVVLGGLWALFSAYNNPNRKDGI